MAKSRVRDGGKLFQTSGPQTANVHRLSLNWMRYFTSSQFSAMQTTVHYSMKFNMDE